MTRLQAEKELEQIISADNICVRQSGANVKVSWDHCALTYAQLHAISELFGTDAIDVDSGQEAGSCCSNPYDYVKLTIRGVDLED